MISKRIASSLLSAALLFSGCMNVLADEQQAISADNGHLNELLYSEHLNLSYGLYYTRNIYSHKDYGNEREYILEYTPSEYTSLGFACNDYLYKTSQIRDIAALNYPDENFVAGINGDFFNLSTGVPESAFIKDYELYTTDRDTFCLAEADDGRYFFDKPGIVIKMYSESGTEISIAHLNKEFSEYALYLYNSRYSTTTHIKNKYSSAVLLPYDDVKTTEELIEYAANAELTAAYDTLSENGQPDKFYSMLEEATGYKYIGGKFYLIVGVFPSIGYSENLVVYSTDSDCTDSVIPENAYLLCGDNKSYGYIPAGMKPGDTFELKINGNEAYHNVINAIGVGDIIVNDGKAVYSERLSHYTSLQPRSAVGIKADGTIVFYAVDGRQAKNSAGLKLKDIAEIMKSLGCTYAANLDGGGSTVVNAFRPGTDGASTVNYPSGGAERKIANGFVFTNTLEKNDIPYSAHVYSDSIITYSDWLFNIPDALISDSNGFAYLAENEESVPDVKYYTTDGISVVAEGVLYPSGVLGEIDVYSSVNGMLSENPAFSVFTINSPDKIALSADKTEIAPFETVNLSVNASYKNLDVISDNASYIWAVKTADEPYATGLNGKVENGVFYPYADGSEYTITALRGEAADSVTITVDAYPFEDIKNHWAVKEIYKLAKDGVVNGYPDDFTGLFYYLPQRSYSRYEFCVMLNRMTEIGDDIIVPDRYAVQIVENVEEVSEEINENSAVKPLNQNKTNTTMNEVPKSTAKETALLDFADAESIPDWAYDSVYKLYAAGLINDILKLDEYGNQVFNGADFITRADVMRVIGRFCEDAPEDYSTEVFYDLTNELSADAYIKKCLYSGIFSGYEDMSIRPYGLLTRAEAAAVFVRLDEYLN